MRAATERRRNIYKQPDFIDEMGFFIDKEYDFIDKRGLQKLHMSEKMTTFVSTKGETLANRTLNKTYSK